MRVSAGFRDFVLDQLSGVKGLHARAMFGGVGLYVEDVFFGILAADVLFFKVDDASLREYEKAGSSPFKPYADRAMTMPYYSVPIAGTRRRGGARGVGGARSEGGKDRESREAHEDGEAWNGGKNEERQHEMITVPRPA